MQLVWYTESQIGKTRPDYSGTQTESVSWQSITMQLETDSKIQAYRPMFC